MNNRVSILLSGLLAVLIGYLIYTFFEYYDEERDLGWGRNAQKNPFLAIGKFSETYGVTVESVDSILKIASLDSYDTLFITQSGQVLSENRMQELLGWVNAGGHLIVAAQRPSGEERDRLFEYFDIKLHTTDFKRSVFDNDIFDEAEDDELTEEEKKNREVENKKKFIDQLREFNENLKKQGLLGESEEDKSPQENTLEYEKTVDAELLTKLTFEDVPGELRIEFNPEIAISHPAFDEEDWDEEKYQPTYWRGENNGTHFLQLNSGDGLVTVISDSEIFRSENIANFEHAYLWYILTGGATAAIVYGSNMPSLWYMLVVFMPELLLALGVFICAWIWFNIRRFGPIREENIQVRRSSAEHIQASAGYMWRGGWQGSLLAPVREEIQQQAEKLIAGYDSAEQNERVNLLSLACKLDSSAVSAAMESNEDLNEESFYQTVRILQKIRESL